MGSRMRPMSVQTYWSVEQCRWVESPPVEATVPAQREDASVQETADA